MEVSTISEPQNISLSFPIPLTNTTNSQNKNVNYRTSLAVGILTPYEANKIPGYILRFNLQADTGITLPVIHDIDSFTGLAAGYQLRQSAKVS